IYLVFRDIPSLGKRQKYIRHSTLDSSHLTSATTSNSFTRSKRRVRAPPTLIPPFWAPSPGGRKTPVSPNATSREGIDRPHSKNGHDEIVGLFISLYCGGPSPLPRNGQPLRTSEKPTQRTQIFA